jgi:phospholipid/cholesterol/gamma-HCH transport system substrate-binding protein
MTRSLRATRAWICVTMGALVVLGSAACGGERVSDSSDYCAVFPDSIGLYAGNPVTQMGFQIGTIRKITASATSVQVDFSATDTRPLPGDVKAVVRSTSILADRALELVGNYRSGPKLQSGTCIPLDRSFSPKSLSEVIDSADTFLNGITPENSTNVQDALSQVAQAAKDNGAAVNQILSASSRLLDSPDQAISDLKSIVDNTSLLTETLVASRAPMKQILNDAVVTTPDANDATVGSTRLLVPLPPLILAVNDLETHAGDEISLTLDAVADVLRANSPHTLGWISVLGGILKPLPWWINTAANHFNNKGFDLFYRPPMYRIRTPNGAVVCNIMNASNPGSCANIAGQPYGVDINLLQYVFMEASR